MNKLAYWMLYLHIMGSPIWALAPATQVSQTALRLQEQASLPLGGSPKQDSTDEQLKQALIVKAKQLYGQVISPKKMSDKEFLWQIWPKGYLAWTKYDIQRQIESLKELVTVYQMLNDLPGLFQVQAFPRDWLNQRFRAMSFSKLKDEKQSTLKRGAFALMEEGTLLDQLFEETRGAREQLLQEELLARGCGPVKTLGQYLRLDIFQKKKLLNQCIKRKELRNQLLAKEAELRDKDFDLWVEEVLDRKFYRRPLDQQCLILERYRQMKQFGLVIRSDISWHEDDTGWDEFLEVLQQEPALSTAWVELSNRFLAVPSLRPNSVWVGVLRMIEELKEEWVGKEEEQVAKICRRSNEYLENVLLKMEIVFQEMEIDKDGHGALLVKMMVSERASLRFVMNVALKWAEQKKKYFQKRKLIFPGVAIKSTDGWEDWLKERFVFYWLQLLQLKDVGEEEEYLKKIEAIDQLWQVTILLGKEVELVAEDTALEQLSAEGEACLKTVMFYRGSKLSEANQVAQLRQVLKNKYVRKLFFEQACDYESSFAMQVKRMANMLLDVPELAAELSSIEALEVDLNTKRLMVSLRYLHLKKSVSEVKHYVAILGYVFDKTKSRLGELADWGDFLDFFSDDKGAWFHGQFVDIVDLMADSSLEESVVLRLKLLYEKKIHLNLDQLRMFFGFEAHVVNLFLDIAEQKEMIGEEWIKIFDLYAKSSYQNVLYKWVEAMVREGQYRREIILFFEILVQRRYQKEADKLVGKFFGSMERGSVSKSELDRLSELVQPVKMLFLLFLTDSDSMINPEFLDFTLRHLGSPLWTEESFEKLLAHAVYCPRERWLEQTDVQALEKVSVMPEYNEVRLQMVRDYVWTDWGKEHMVDVLEIIQAKSYQILAAILDLVEDQGSFTIDQWVEYGKAANDIYAQFGEEWALGMLQKVKEQIPLERRVEFVKSIWIKTSYISQIESEQKRATLIEGLKKFIDAMLSFKLRGLDAHTLIEFFMLWSNPEELGKERDVLDALALIFDINIASKKEYRWMIKLLKTVDLIRLTCCEMEEQVAGVMVHYLREKLTGYQNPESNRLSDLEDFQQKFLLVYLAARIRRCPLFQDIQGLLRWAESIVDPEIIKNPFLRSAFHDLIQRMNKMLSDELEGDGDEEEALDVLERLNELLQKFYKNPVEQAREEVNRAVREMASQYPPGPKSPVGNRQARIALIHAGYRPSLWANVIEVSADVDQRKLNYRDELCFKLMALYGELVDIASGFKKYWTVIESSLRFEEVIDMFQITTDIDALRSQRDDLVRIIEQALQLNLMDPNLKKMQLKARKRMAGILMEEQKINRWFCHATEESPDLGPLPKKKFRVRWVNDFLETVCSSGDQIPGCYGLAGYHAEKPLITALTDDTFVVCLYDDAGKELENVEVRMSLEGLYVWRRYGFSLDYDTDELWALLWQKLLISKMVPSIILAPGAPGERCFREAGLSVSEEKRLTFLSVLFYDRYYDSFPTALTNGELVLRAEAASRWVPSSLPSELEEDRKSMEEMVRRGLESIILHLMAQTVELQNRIFLASLVKDYLFGGIEEQEFKARVIHVLRNPPKKKRQHQDNLTSEQVDGLADRIIDSVKSLSARIGEEEETDQLWKSLQARGIDPVHLKIEWNRRLEMLTRFSEEHNAHLWVRGELGLLENGQVRNLQNPVPSKNDDPMLLDDFLVLYQVVLPAEAQALSAGGVKIRIAPNPTIISNNGRVITLDREGLKEMRPYLDLLLKNELWQIGKREQYQIPARAAMNHPALVALERDSFIVALSGERRERVKEFAQALEAWMDLSHWQKHYTLELKQAYEQMIAMLQEVVASLNEGESFVSIAWSDSSPLEQLRTKNEPLAAVFEESFAVLAAA